MSVARNIGYPLKLAKAPQAEVARQVAEVADVLQLTEVLGRTPAQLSGGQRQLVAMGRAIIRQPRAFLLDEPLSNLGEAAGGDAGRDRPAAARAGGHDGVRDPRPDRGHDHGHAGGGAQGRPAPAGRDPQRLYDEPVNLFVATFIGSPAMNLFAGTVGKAEDGGFSGALAVVGNQRLVLDPAVVAAHPWCASWSASPSSSASVRRRSATRHSGSGTPVGPVREAGAHAGRVIEATVDLVESLGAELVVHVEVTDIPPLGGDPSGSWQVVGCKGRAWPASAPAAGWRPAKGCRSRSTRPPCTCSTSRPGRRCDSAPTSRPAWRARRRRYPIVSPAAPAGARRRRSRHGTPARPPMSEPVLVAGLDVGGTKTLAVAIVADRAATSWPDGDDGAPRPAVVATVRRPTGVGGGDRLLASTAAVLADLAVAAACRSTEFAAVGVGVPGLVDRAAGTVRRAVNLGLDDTPVPWASTCGPSPAPVVVDNDVNLAAVGAAVAPRVPGRPRLPERRHRPRRRPGARRPSPPGAHGAAGGIGILPVDPQGPLCDCGQRGCLEVLASGTAIAARWTAGDGDVHGVGTAGRGGGGDPDAVAVLDDVAGHLAGAVALLAQTVDPDVIVLGGGVAEAGRACSRPCAMRCGAVRARSPVLAAIDLANRVALVPDGVHAGALGAAVFARHHLGTDGRTARPQARGPMCLRARHDRSRSHRRYGPGNPRARSLGVLITGGRIVEVDPNVGTTGTGDRRPGGRSENGTVGAGAERSVVDAPVRDDAVPVVGDTPPAAGGAPGWRCRDGEVARLGATDLLVAPGFLDLQCNGAVGVDLTSRPERLWQVAALPRWGVTAWLPTVVTAAGRPRRAQALRSAPPTGDPVASPLGLHLEGLFLAPSAGVLTTAAHHRPVVGRDRRRGLVPGRGGGPRHPGAGVARRPRARAHAGRPGRRGGGRAQLVHRGPGDGRRRRRHVRDPPVQRHGAPPPSASPGWRASP